MDELGTILWRPNGVQRVVGGIGWGAMVLVLLVLLLQDPLYRWGWIGWLAILALVFALLGVLRKKCVLTDREIIAQGRFSKRVIPLADVVQVGESPGTSSVWVRCATPRFNGGDTTMLRMIPMARASLQGGPTVATAVSLIRARATAAGATLEPPLDGPTRPRSTKPLVFSI